jgi:RNA polymerase sigma-70 factor (ECF subfamily)
MQWDRVDAEELFRACADRSDPRAWPEFVRRYGALIERTAYKTASRYTAPTRELLDDLVQECYVKICSDGCNVLRVFRQIRPDSDFGYLKVITSHAVLDCMRRHKMDRLLIPFEDAPELSGTDTHREIQIREIEKCLVQVTQGPTGDRDRMIFNLHYRQGLTANAISRIPSIELSCKGVESLLGRLRRALQRCLGGSARSAASGASQ